MIYIPFEKFIKKNNLKSLDKEIQKFKYDCHEENRKLFIDEAKQKRLELINKSKEKKDLSNSYVLSHGEELLNNERERAKFFKNQQIGELLNMIDREYKREEMQKRRENKDKKLAEHDEEAQKLKNKEPLRELRK